MTSGPGVAALADEGAGNTAYLFDLGDTDHDESEEDR